VSETTRLRPEPRPAVAILPWGDCLEDFFDALGVTLDDLCVRFTGSWQFGYARALSAASVDTVLVYVSERVRTVTHRTHLPTGARIVVLPAGRRHRALRDAARRTGSSALKQIAAYFGLPAIALRSELDSHGCRAILVQEYESPRFDRAVQEREALGRPVFATFQGGSRTLSWVEHRARRHAIRRADGFIVAPERERKRLQAHYGVAPERIHAIPNPIDTTAFTPRDRRAAREQLGLPGDAVVVAWHGRVDLAQKGLDLLIDVWPSVSTAIAGRDVRLLLIGDGPDRSALDARIASLCDRTVTRIPRFLHDPVEIAGHLAAADVWTFPSRLEGSPIAPAEALACSIPIVAADVSGVQEILGDSGAGIVFPAGDRAALEAALIRALTDDIWRFRSRERARARAVSEFSVASVGLRLRNALGV
jgi:glycosyltransferase involved in cell wall biosynthesis